MAMIFGDEEVEKLRSSVVDDVVRLIVEYLCGEKYYKPLSKDDKKLIKSMVNKINQEGCLNYEQFNELLLLLNQGRMGKDFFRLFFQKDKVSFDDIKNGIVKFRGFAMLCFGNFKFAYKQLVDKSENEIKERLQPCYKEESKLIDKFKSRPGKMLEIKKIKGCKTWLVGEITGQKVSKEAKSLTEKMTRKNNLKISEELKEFSKQLLRMDKDTKKIQKKAFTNADIYLTWDYMDVYVATSMRHKWEFEETSNFINKVFEDTALKQLNLRYFDPTQSKCTNPRDKGLIEGLMLKRASCAIYMVQESDTMGKASELAVTLSQGKPVIAYVPKIKPAEYSNQKKIRERPLEFFQKRLLSLKAEGIFNEPECVSKLQEYEGDFEIIINNFLTKLEEYRKSQPFSLWFKKDSEFKNNYKDFPKVCRILAIAESYNFDRRANLLKERHPLSMQVDLQTGVSNGVLVVRNSKQCAKLLYKILTNSMEFRIMHKKEGFTILEEKLSGCPFRIVTDYERLSNSFWDFFI